MTPDRLSAALELSARLCKEFEGFESHPYKCAAGVWTIGYGTTRYPDGRKVNPTDAPVTEQQATDILKTMLKGFQASVLQYCPAINSVELLAACTDLAYNIGSNAFGSSTLRKVINDSGDAIAIAEQFRRWNKGGGKVLAGLVRRREAAIELFSSKTLQA